MANIYYQLMVKIWTAVSCLALTLFMPSTASAKQGGVSIDSFRVVKTSPESVDIELIGSNDGSQGPICLGAMSKSKDGSVRSENFKISTALFGKEVHVAAQVARPNGLGRPRTDFLMVIVYTCGEEVILRRKFEWPYIWPEKMTGGATDNTDLGTRSSWWAFFQNLEEEDFAALDALMKKWNSPNERDKDGMWKLDGFRSALNYPVRNRDWQGDLQRIRRWQEFNQESPGAAIAEARYWISYAWHIRGSEDNENIDPVAMTAFRERMKRAEQVLKNSKSFASNNPLWYESYLYIAVSTRRNHIFVENLFNEGIRKHPYFQPLYADMVKYWSPISGKKVDWKKVDEVIDQGTNLTTAMDGLSNYAWLYIQVNNQQKFEFDLFRDSLVSWIKMRDSFEELVKRYPSPDNLNEFAAFACRAGDREVFLKIRFQIKNRWVPDKWPSNYSLDLCDHRFMQYS